MRSYPPTRCRLRERADSVVGIDADHRWAGRKKAILRAVTEQAQLSLAVNAIALSVPPTRGNGRSRLSFSART